MSIVRNVTVSTQETRPKARWIHEHDMKCGSTKCEGSVAKPSVLEFVKTVDAILKT